MSSMFSSADRTCRIRVHADIVSLGGGVLLALCLLFTALTGMAFYLPAVSRLQGAIVGAMCMLAWLYFLQSAGEELLYRGGSLVHVSWGRSTREIPLAGVASVVLVHQGLNSEPGIETLEVRYPDHVTERVLLGPCWQRNKLEAFFHALEEILGKPKSFEEVR